MTSSDLSQALVLGPVVAVVYQLFKAPGLNRWLQVLIALGVAGTVGYLVPGIGGDSGSALGAAATVTATVATHSTVFSGTKVGMALEQDWFAKGLRASAKAVSALADAVGRGNGTPPTAPGTGGTG